MNTDWYNHCFLDLQCWVLGSCVGNTITVDYVPNEESCLTTCQSDETCKWLTFDESNGACILLTDCAALGVTDCDTCWSSQVQCGERKG